MNKISAQRLEQIFSNFGGHKILILGDLMLDEYIWGSVSRISPEAPVPVVEIMEESLKLGGAANVALNVKALENVPLLVGVVGRDRNGERLKEILAKSGISSQGVFIDEDRQTTVKTRIIAHSQQVVRADRENTDELSADMTFKLMDFIKKNIIEEKISALLISDYGKGVISLNLLNEVINFAKENKIFISVDPKETHFMNYKNVSLITPNHNEAGFAYGKRIKDEISLEEVGWGLLERLETEALLITRGERGMSLFEKTRKLTHFPTVAKKVYDVTGAGDTVISAFTCAFAAGASLKESALISNHAAGIVVGELGTAQVTKEELYRDLKNYVE
ncbi:MAG: D-glycero-beta-D-manno-heptose-7-phosphate kinase [candidate division Zixibacteria bacterium]|nr:D-glycero-beta-D-manno-heptose-7-phosphate kinase [candidate division Zixibacteria bacterium]